MSSDITDFNNYSHSDLRKMAEAMNSGDVMSASDPWRRAAATLKQIRTALDTASGDATDTWEGSTSNAFYEKMTKLAGSVNNTAAYANDAANTLQMMSEAIDEAKREMPEEPGFLAQVGNAISDTAQSAVGIEDDSTQIPLADRKKAEAVAVMQTLANKYRTATPVLKPPAMTSPSEVDKIPPPDPTASAAASAFIMGAGLGAIGGYSTSAAGKDQSSPVRTTVPAVESPRTSTARTAAPTDAGIQGGVANPAPKPPRTVGIGAEPAPVSGQQPTASGATGGGAGTSLANAGSLGASPAPTGGASAAGSVAGVTGGGSTAMPMGFGGGLTGNSGRTAGAAPAKCEPIDGGLMGEETGGRSGGSKAAGGSGAVFDPEGVPSAGAARPVGSGAGARAGGVARQAQGAIGEAEGEERAVGGRQKAFTEGGTGLGARGRVPAEPEGTGPEGMGFLPGSAQELKRKKRREGKRAEYLVEDEETWMPDEDANPHVVE